MFLAKWMMSFCTSDASIIYLRFAAFVATFRALMYVFNYKVVTECKFDPSSLRNQDVRDVAYAYSSLIRVFMFFKAFVFGLGSFIQIKSHRDVLSTLSFVFDVYLLIKIIVGRQYPKKSALLPGTTIATSIQTVLTISFPLLYLITIMCSR